MSWWSKAKSYVSSKISRKKTVVKQSVVSAPTRSVKVTDYVGGGSKTTSSYTPGTTTRATGGGSSGGGGSSAPVQLDIEPKELVQNKENNIGKKNKTFTKEQVIKEESHIMFLQQVEK